MAQQQQLAQINRSGDGGDSGSGASPRMAQRGAHLGAATNRHQRPQAMHWSEQQQPHQQQQQSLKSPSHSTITLLNTMQQLHQQHSSSFVGGVGATNGRSASSVSTRQKQQFQVRLLVLLVGFWHFLACHRLLSFNVFFVFLLLIFSNYQKTEFSNYFIRCNKRGHNNRRQQQ